MNKEEQDGYVTVEAVVLLPLASILILMLVYLGSYLYQETFLMQAAYAAALRGSRYPQRGEGYVQEQLEELLDKEALRFAPEKREIEANGLWVQVALERETPFLRFTHITEPLQTTQRAMVRDAVAYIRGIRRLKESCNE